MKYQCGRKTRKSNYRYIAVYYPCHPKARKGWVLQHRAVMEIFLGRYLESFEIVHHINKITTDNHIENLILMVKGKNWHPCLCPKCGFDFLVR